MCELTDKNDARSCSHPRKGERVNNDNKDGKANAMKRFMKKGLGGSEREAGRQADRQTGRLGGKELSREAQPRRSQLTTRERGGEERREANVRQQGLQKRK